MVKVTFPPEAQREPSGDTVTVFRYPVWPMWLVFSLQLARFHTCYKRFAHILPNELRTGQFTETVTKRIVYT